MDYLHIIFSFANVFAFVAIGSIIAYFVQKDWKKLKKIPTRKFVSIVATAAVFGGLFGVLVNGIGNFSNAITNMSLAISFALFAIAPYSLSGKKLA